MDRVQDLINEFGERRDFFNSQYKSALTPWLLCNLSQEINLLSFKKILENNNIKFKEDDYSLNFEDRISFLNSNGEIKQVLLEVRTNKSPSLSQSIKEGRLYGEFCSQFYECLRHLPFFTFTNSWGGSYLHEESDVNVSFYTDDNREDHLKIQPAVSINKYSASWLNSSVHTLANSYNIFCGKSSDTTKKNHFQQFFEHEKSRADHQDNISEMNFEEFYEVLESIEFLSIKVVQDLPCILLFMILGNSKFQDIIGVNKRCKRQSLEIIYDTTMNIAEGKINSSRADFIEFGIILIDQIQNEA